jgi:hypothetical protein
VKEAQRQIPAIVTEVLLKIATEIDWDRAMLNDPTSSPEMVVRGILESRAQEHPFPLANKELYTIKQIMEAKKARGIKGADRATVQRDMKQKFQPYGKAGKEHLYKGEDVRVYVIGKGRKDSRALLTIFDRIQDREQLKTEQAKWARLPKLQMEQHWKQLSGVAALKGPESLARIMSKAEYQILFTNVQDSLVKMTGDLCRLALEEMPTKAKTKSRKEKLSTKAAKRAMKHIEKEASKLIVDKNKLHSKGPVSSQQHL